jgi:hypothetical protein
MPNPLVGAIGAGLGSSIIGASSARSAARSQEASAREQVQLAERIYNQDNERFEPFYGAGQQGLNALRFEMGLGDRPQGWQGLSMTPAGQFALTQGRDEVEAGAAMRGGLNSGSTLGALERLRMGLATQDRDNQLNRLAGFADMGLGAAGRQSQAGAQFVGAGQGALANLGDARAAGRIGVGNALTGGMNNALMTYGFMSNPAAFAGMGR